MAHDTQVTGAISELTAARALMASGWQVSQPLVAEAYDLVGRDPVNGQFATFQVKTIRKRSDRNGELVIYAKKGNGQAYTTDDCDYLIGIDGQTAYMMECRGISEYWASEASASKRWIELTAERESEVSA